jgi:hypothetical protein
MTQPAIILIGGDTWAAEAARRLGERYTALHYTERGGYVARLADDRAALVLIDAETRPDWHFFATTPKSSPATRRIPVVVIAAAADRRGQALAAGADRAVAPDEWEGEGDSLVAALARITDPADAQRLRSQCDEPLPAEALRAIALFNAGEYYRQHDTFEALWVAEEGPVRDLYRAILQVGVAYYQIERGNGRGALKMLLRSVQWLALLPDICQGVDVAHLKADAAAVRAELERVGEDGLDQFDRALLQPVRLIEPE